MNLCSHEKCTSRVLAKSLCGKHYQRWRKHGDPSASLVGGRQAKEAGPQGIALRDWSKVTQSESGCWLWTGSLHRGYGRIQNGSVIELAHRHFYRLIVGKIPEGLQIDHLCRVRNCVNPAHLEPVPQKVNVLRGVGISAENKRKTHCLRGHPFEGGNLGIDSHGDRFCKTCKNERQRISRARKRNAK
ncbi:HNH endonuclease signature motif containing protein [Glutamicibacter arilaitensis]|uniref:HNH endonuclease signature motif containing protein n=1 Tax=Glutamicibacter arilaitensis TaxID=256701 RepID=UPI003F939B25